MLQHSGRAAFLISKPLQLMIALCIVQQGEWDTKPVFVILDAFNGAGEVAERLSHDFDQFQSPVFFTSRQEALAFLKQEKFAHLFIDSDVGVKNFMALASQKLSNSQLLIHVYEEGMGTYRSDLYADLQKRLFSFFGIGAFFGGSRFVSRIYVFHVQEYIDQFPSNGYKARAIRGGVSQFLMENRSALKRVFGFEGVVPSSKNASLCSLYLSSWKVDEDFISFFKRLKGDLFIKPHPHIRNSNEFEGVRTIGANVPAELVIGDLMETYEVVRVFDHQSSARRYISGTNLTFAIAQAQAVRERAALDIGPVI